VLEIVEREPIGASKFLQIGESAGTIIPRVTHYEFLRGDAWCCYSQTGVVGPVHFTSLAGQYQLELGEKNQRIGKLCRLACTAKPLSYMSLF
jgi:hypothetical protein